MVMVAVKFELFSSCVWAITVDSVPRNGRFSRAIRFLSWLFSKPFSACSSRSWPMVACSFSFSVCSDP